MSKKLNKVLLLLLVAVFLFTITGCTIVPLEPSDEDDTGNVRYISADGPFLNEGDNCVAKERADLLSIVTSKQTEFDKFAKYDDNYFKTKALVVFQITEPCRAVRSEITSYSIQQGAISINVETPTVEDDTDCCMAYYYFVVELSAEEAATINEVEIVKNGTKLQGETQQHSNFYSFSAALTLSWITLDDIKSFLYDRPPYEPLDETIALKIKEAQIDDVKRGIYKADFSWKEGNPGIEDVSILYYGKYKDCYIVKLSRAGYCYLGMQLLTVDFGDGMTYTHFDTLTLIWHEA